MLCCHPSHACRRGPLTCSVGVSLKMAVGQLTQWAAEAGVKEDKVGRLWAAGWVEGWAGCERGLMWGG